MSFINKVVIVTGGSAGIGAAATTIFAKEGADVVIVGRNENKLKKISDEVSKFGKIPLVIKADISKEEETRSIVKKTIEKFGKLDVLVINAALNKQATILDENLLQVYDEVMNTNLRSTVLLINLAAPHLVKTKGNIVNISSVAGLSPIASFGRGYASYCASKAGMDHFSRVAAVELAEKGVRVNIISPGPVQTEMLESVVSYMTQEDMAQSNPLKILTQPEDVAELIVYLASDKAKSITGVNYTVDAGFKLTV